MMRDDFENLSDVELRQKLRQNGFPNLPVTETTRKVLIKKLKNHLANENKKKRQARNSAPAERHIEYGTTVNSGRQTLRMLPEANADFISRSYTPIIEKPKSYSASPVGGIQLQSTPETVQRTKSSSKMYAPPPILASDENDSTDYSCYKTNTDLRSPYWHNKSGVEMNNFSNSPTHAAHNPHFGVVNRLLSLRDRTLRKPTTPSQTYYSSDDSEISHLGTPKRSMKYKNVTTPRSLVSSVMSRLSAQTGLKQVIIPYALIGALLIFILFLIFMYMNMSPDILNTLRKNNTNFLECEEIDKLALATSGIVDCIEKDRLDPAIMLNKKLIQLLQERAEHHMCHDKNEPAAVSFVDFVRYLISKGMASDLKEINQSLLDVEYLIKMNPQWKVMMDNTEGTVSVIDNDDKNLGYKKTTFMLLKPKLPLMCILRNKLQKFFLIVGIGTIICAAALFLYVLVRFILSWRNERVVAIDTFTKDIIKEVIYKASVSEVPEDKEVIVNHLRDKLISPSKRRKLLWSWNKALEQLEKNDSRIFFGNTVHNGEHHRCMKWMGNTLQSPRARDRDRTCAKQWQSPAFDNSNVIVNPPTECLKIRHMFDASEIDHPKLKQVISKSILEKVGTRCKIVDIQIDLQTCCVYLRCASERDAGIVHNEINGWWFDKRLVSIKFLRLQRYLARFPNSKSSSPITSSDEI